MEPLLDSNGYEMYNRMIFNGEDTCDFSSYYDKNNNLIFAPPAFLQRYYAVRDVLSSERFKDYIHKVADFGCSTMKFFKYLKNLPNIEKIYLIDVDEEVLTNNSCSIHPLIYDCVHTLGRPLAVDLFVGSIGDVDIRLCDADAVTCIELIEHLQPDILAKVPDTIFGFIKPNVAIFTTPNYEFNAVFKTSGFRHYDHKFEWIRKEFKQWSYNIIAKYEEYDVYFVGIGPGPPGSEKYGYSTQMAVFYRKNMCDGSSSSPNIIEPKESYELKEKIQYPYSVDKRTPEERFKDTLNCFINRYRYKEDFISDVYYESAIPLSVLLPHFKCYCDDLISLRKKISETSWDLRSVNGEYAVFVNNCHSSDSEIEHDST